MEAHLTLEGIQKMCQNTLIDQLGIEFTKFDKDSLQARMPVDERTLQPMGILHGGASLALIETVGSGLSFMLADLSRYKVVGLSVTANHVKSAHRGFVYGTARFIHKGNQTQVVEVEIKDEEGCLISTGRITNMIIELS